MDSPLFTVDPEIIAAVASANSFLWDIPDTANRKGDPHKPGGEAWWNEIVEIADTSIEVDPKDESGGTLLMKVKFTVPPITNSINVGRNPQTAWFRWTPAAIRDSKHDRYKASSLNLDRALKLMTALGLDTSGGINFNAYLNENGGVKWAVGKRVTTLIRHNWYKDKPRQEFVDYMAVK